MTKAEFVSDFYAQMEAATSPNATYARSLFLRLPSPTMQDAVSVLDVISAEKDKSYAAIACEIKRLQDKLLQSQLEANS